MDFGFKPSILLFQSQISCNRSSEIFLSTILKSDNPIDLIRLGPAWLSSLDPLEPRTYTLNPWASKISLGSLPLEYDAMKISLKISV